jgi:hypothetical protein
MIIDDHYPFRLWQVAFRILVSRSGVFHFSHDHFRDSSRNALKPAFGFVENPGGVSFYASNNNTLLGRLSDAGNLD